MDEIFYLLDVDNTHYVTKDALKGFVDKKYRKWLSSYFKAFSND